jgi:hypothetical protein
MSRKSQKPQFKQPERLGILNKLIAKKKRGLTYIEITKALNMTYAAAHSFVYGLGPNAIKELGPNRTTYVTIKQGDEFRSPRGKAYCPECNGYLIEARTKSTEELRFCVEPIKKLPDPSLVRYLKSSTCRKCKIKFNLVAIKKVEYIDKYKEFQT